MRRKANALLILSALILVVSLIIWATDWFLTKSIESIEAEKKAVIESTRFTLIHEEKVDNHLSIKIVEDTYSKKRYLFFLHGASGSQMVELGRAPSKPSF